MSTLIQDVKLALRMVVRGPRSAATAVVMLAVGFGTITAMFGVMDKVILDPLPYPNPGELYKVVDAPWPPSGDSVAWWGKSGTFSDLAIYRTGGANLSQGGRPIRVSACAASPGFFGVFGTNPKRGRGFRADEGTPGRDRVVVISHSLWSTQFRRDPGALGSTISLNGVPFILVGIMPPGFGFPGHTALWIPRKFANQEHSAGFDLGPYQQEDVPIELQVGMVGRLRKGISRLQAQARLQVLADRMPVRFARSGISFRGIRVRLIPLRELMAGDARTSVFALFGAVVLVALIACANLANLLAARVVDRQMEFGVRLALGATLPRLATQLVAESTLLSLSGGILGVLLAWRAMPLLRKFGPTSFPRLSDVSLDIRVVAFALGISLGAGLAIGLAASLTGLRTNLNGRLRGGGSPAIAAGVGKARAAMVVMEVTLAFALVSGSGLFITTLIRLRRAPLGFNPHHVLTFEVGLPATKYSTFADDQAFQRRLLQEMRSLPGVRAIGTVDRLPLGALNAFSVYVDVRGAGGVPMQGMTRFLTVGGDFFRAMGVPSIPGGRLFRPTDDEDAPAVALVNRSFVGRFFKGGNPVGKPVMVEGEAGLRQIIGVVGDFGDRAQGAAPVPLLFLPTLQPYRGVPVSGFSVVMRTLATDVGLARSIPEAVAKVDPQIATFQIRTMEDVLSGASAPARFRSALLVAFGSFALMLALSGIYSIAAWSVNTRAREIAIRMALGAQKRATLKMVMAEGLVLSLVGIGFGLAAALALSRLVVGLLYGVKATDPLTYAGTAVLLVATTAVGCYIPARRATRIDLMSELRHD